MATEGFQEVEAGFLLERDRIGRSSENGTEIQDKSISHILYLKRALKEVFKKNKYISG